MLALAAPLASAAPLRFSYNFLLAPHSPVIPAHLKFPYRFCPPTRPAPASAQPSFCAGFAAQKLLIRFGHADRVGPLEAYCIGLLLPSERKSVEPMAAVTAPDRVSAQHQSLLHFISQGGWSDGKVLGKVREMVVPEMERHGPIEAWIIDDTGFPKQGKHSVGVARQYCGRLGKQDNCQVAVTLSLANHHASLPVAYRLYLPKEWANDEARCHKAGVPDDIGFMTKPEIALEQIRWACEAGQQVCPAAWC